MFKFSETNHVHKIFSTYSISIAYDLWWGGKGSETSQGRGGGVGKESRKWEYPLVEYDMG